MLTAFQFKAAGALTDPDCFYLFWSLICEVLNSCQYSESTFEFMHSAFFFAPLAWVERVKLARTNLHRKYKTVASA